jgi:hypothetical protein
MASIAIFAARFAKKIYAQNRQGDRVIKETISQR